MLCSHSSFSLWHSVECKGYVSQLYTLVCNVWRHQIWARRKEAEIGFEFLLFHFWSHPLILFLFPHSKCNALFRRRTGRKRSPCDRRVWCGQWKEFPEFLPLKNVTGSGGRDDWVLENTAVRGSKLERALENKLEIIYHPCVNRIFCVRVWNRKLWTLNLQPEEVVTTHQNVYPDILNWLWLQFKHRNLGCTFTFYNGPCCWKQVRTRKGVETGMMTSLIKCARIKWCVKSSTEPIAHRYSSM